MKMVNKGKEAKSFLSRGAEISIDKKGYKHNLQEEEAFKQIFKLTELGVLNWEPDLEEEDKYHTIIKIKNGLEEETTVPVIFHIGYSEFEDSPRGYLQLGDKNGPCRNTADKRVRNFARTYLHVNNLPIYSHCIKRGKGFELLARLSEFRNIEPFNYKQIEKFPFRVNIKDKRIFNNKIGFNDFINISNNFLNAVGEITKGDAKYSIIIDENTPNADECPEEKYFIYDCRTHQSQLQEYDQFIKNLYRNRTSLSLEDINKETFDNASSIQVGTRMPANVQEGDYEIALLDYYRQDKNIMNIYAEGTHKFKCNLADKIREISLPKGFSLNKKI
jgi:hypothetical protein